ncbi:TetR family transcriptional regulator [Micromonospora sp. ATCC 39149]|uniref:TetR/AcrR family transcriptional regulator n=1 Tax=Micromonospora carbonacea TaxID=47853 RepID=A0A7D5Y6R8_9ACTN|nr:TetR family transcriptional regulator [Micromonospora sp. ATCC 39149]QLJ96921.1 TetR/AcrR family transcriptional regulator [Micromonospora carbonacea]
MSAGQRPGGRSARVRAAVLTATRALLVDGYTGLTVERIAQAAGVNKTSVYRRWTDLEGVLGDLLSEYASEVVPIPDTGDLDTDLEELALLIRRGMAGEPGELLTALAAAVPHNPRAAQIVRGFFAERFGLAEAVVNHAVARGELPQDTDARAAIEVLGAPFFLRLLVVDEPIDEEFARRTAAAVAAALRSGVFSRAREPHPVTGADAEHSAVGDASCSPAS